MPVRRLVTEIFNESKKNKNKIKKGPFGKRKFDTQMSKKAKQENRNRSVWSKRKFDTQMSKKAKQEIEKGPFGLKVSSTHR